MLVDAHPDEVAYELVGQAEGRMTFRAWEEESNRLAHGLIDRGVRPGDRVALLFEPTDALRQMQAYVAVHKAGAVNVPVNARLAPAEVARMLGHAEPTAAFASPSLLEVLRKSRDEVPSLASTISTGEAGDGELAWEDVRTDDADDVQASITADDIADIVYTSGTTGAPKGVVSRHRNATPVGIGAPQWNGLRWFHASPLSTVAGITFIFIPMRIGMTGVYMPRFEPGAFLDLVEEGRAQMCFLVPAMIELLLAREDLPERDLSSINLATVGSAPIAPSTLLAFNDTLPNGTVINAFSLTESGGSQIILPADEVERRPGSVGRPVPPIEVRIIDEDGDDVPPGEIGEVLLRNPGKEREYYRDPEATAQTWRDGWLHTGDLGRVDDEGFLYIVGRKKDVIIRGGNNIHAADVEATLYEHPDVAEAAVFGVPHDVLGEDVAAAIVLRTDAEVSADELESWCRERLAPYKVPRHITFRSSLPRNATGKVLKPALRDDLSGSGTGS